MIDWLAEDASDCSRMKRYCLWHAKPLAQSPVISLKLQTPFLLPFYPGGTDEKDEDDKCVFHEESYLMYDLYVSDISQIAFARRHHRTP